MNFKQWLLSEEIFPQNNTATVYHRTKSVDSVSNMLTQEVKDTIAKFIENFVFEDKGTRVTLTRKEEKQPRYWDAF